MPGAGLGGFHLLLCVSAVAVGAAIGVVIVVFLVDDTSGSLPEKRLVAVERTWWSAFRP